MADFETHPAGTDDLVKRLRSNTPNMAIGLARHQAAARIEQLEAELTRANAETAAAFEAAAREVENDAGEFDHPSTHYTFGRLAAAIRALATPDQTAALHKLIAEAEARVLDALAGPLWRLILRDEGCIEYPCLQVDCECRQKLSRIIAASKKGGA